MKLFGSLLIVLLMFTAIFADYLKAPKGADIFVFKSEASMNFASKWLASGKPAFRPEFVETIIAIGESGTDCIVLKSKLGKKQVKILSGVHRGVVGWTPSEFVELSKPGR